MNCPPGQYESALGCSLCPVNTYLSSFNNETNCHPCVDHTDTRNISGSAVCYCPSRGQLVVASFDEYGLSNCYAQSEGIVLGVICSLMGVAIILLISQTCWPGWLAFYRRQRQRWADDAQPPVQEENHFDSRAAAPVTQSIPTYVLGMPAGEDSDGDHEEICLPDQHITNQTNQFLQSVSCSSAASSNTRPTHVKSVHRDAHVSLLASDGHDHTHQEETL
jgi:hypothetical protein